MRMTTLSQIILATTCFWCSFIFVSGRKSKAAAAEAEEAGGEPVDPNDEDFLEGKMKPKKPRK